jgi:hypothetical protein
MISPKVFSQQTILPDEGGGKQSNQSDNTQIQFGFTYTPLFCSGPATILTTKILPVSLQQHFVAN